MISKQKEIQITDHRDMEDEEEEVLDDLQEKAANKIARSGTVFR